MLLASSGLSSILSPNGTCVYGFVHGREDILSKGLASMALIYSGRELSCQIRDRAGGLMGGAENAFILTGMQRSRKALCV